MLPLILGSASVYRKALLERLRIPFSIAPANVDEAPLPQEPPRALVSRLAADKARALAPVHPAALIIGSDQAAVAGDEILGKPGGHDRAVAQLSRLSGRRVVFVTSICLLNTRTGRVQLDVVDYAVVFRPLDQGAIERYVAAERPYDCAGAFKSEGLGITLVSRFEGDNPTALIGLPLIRLGEMLRAEGVDLP
jgi:septum formation protein